MRSKAGIVLVFVGALLALRQSLLWIDAHVAIRNDQRVLIAAQNIDPAALFYTQSSLALRAEKTVRRRIAQ